MSATSRTAIGASRPPDRRPSRSRHLSARPSPRQALERLGLLLIDIEEGPEPECYSARERMREMGDEAHFLVAMIRPDGYRCTCADCGDWHECDCEEFRRNIARDKPCWDCRHLRALVRLEVFRKVYRWSATPPAAGGAA